jgi:hypothetical protein
MPAIMQFMIPDDCDTHLKYGIQAGHAKPSSFQQHVYFLAKNVPIEISRATISAIIGLCFDERKAGAKKE